MRTNRRKSTDIIIDFIGMNYIKSLSTFYDLLGTWKEVTRFLEFVYNTLDTTTVYEKMLDYGFTEEKYNLLQLEYSEIDKLAKKYNTTVNTLLIIKGSGVHDMQYYENVLNDVNESFIDPVVKGVFDYAGSFLDIMKGFKTSYDLNLLECMINVELLDKYNIDINKILELKSKYPKKSASYEVVFNNEFNLPDVNTILTPIYTYKDSTGVHEEYLKIEYNYEDYKYQKNELIPTRLQLFTEAFYNKVKASIEGINYNINTSEDRYQYYLTRKANSMLSKYIDKYLSARLKVILEEVITCTELQKLKYDVSKLGHICYKNEHLILDKMKYIAYQLDNLLKLYKVK